MYYFTNESKTILMRGKNKSWTFIPTDPNNSDYREYLKSGIEAKVYPEAPVLPTKSEPVTVEEEVEVLDEAEEPATVEEQTEVPE